MKQSISLARLSLPYEKKFEDDLILEILASFQPVKILYRLKYIVHGNAVF